MEQTSTAEKGIGAMTKAEVTLGSTGLQLRNIDEMFRFAQAVAGSALAPKDFINRPESVLVAIQMGMEVGLPPMAALQNIAVINGRPSIWGDAQLAIVRGTGELEAFEETETNNEIEVVFRELCFEDDAQKRKALKIKLAMMQANIKKDADDYGVSCFVRRRGFNEAFSRFTVSDAKTAGLWKKQGPWTNYPSRMLKSRARSFLLRDQFGDALKGMMSREEAGDIIDITGFTSEVPRAEAAPGPAPVKAPFRRGQTQQQPAQVQTPVESQLGDDGDLGPASVLSPEHRWPEGMGEAKQPANVIDIPTTTEEAKQNPTSAAAEPTAPAATTSPSPSSATAESAATTKPTVAEPKEPKAPKAPFVLPPSKLAAGWTPKPDDIQGSFYEYLSTEEIHVDEFMAWAKSRSWKEPKISDIPANKMLSVLKQRELVRKNILQTRHENS